LEGLVPAAEKRPHPSTGTRHLPEHGLSTAKTIQWVQSGAFLVLIFSLARWQIEPPLQYHAQAPIFFTDSAFFKEFLRYPGGPSQYLALFLQQLYMHPSLGALVTTLLAWGVCGLTGKMLTGAKASAITAAPWLLAGFILLMQTQYGFPWMEFVLGLMAALAGVVLYRMADGWHPWKRAGLFLLLALAVHFVAAGALLCFALWCVLAELFRVQSWRWRCGLGLAFAAVGALLPLLTSRTIFLVPTAQAYWLWLPRYERFQQSWPAAALLAYVSLWLLALYWAQSQRPGVLRRKKDAQPRSMHASRAAWSAGFVWTVVIAGFFLMRDPQTKLRLEVDYYSERGQWDAVLALGPRVRNPDSAIISDINRALAATGQLTQEMFAYPQDQVFNFWLHLHEGVDAERLMKASDLLFDLGQINRAERMAGEALELNGYRPAVLQRLALINVLKEEPNAARLFLNRLARTLTHRDWARRCLLELDLDPTLTQNDQLNSLRPLMLRKDYVGNFGTEELLLQLLEQNPQNRMAFEYLIAHYLLTAQLGKVIQFVGQMRPLGFQSIPRHCEEAILLHEMLTKDQTINLHGYTIQPETIAGFKRFNDRMREYRGDMSQAMPGMKDEFGKTFWFYYVFGCSSAAMRSGQESRL
jgi:hypothetical protein